MEYILKPNGGSIGDLQDIHDSLMDKRPFVVFQRELWISAINWRTLAEIGNNGRHITITVICDREYNHNYSNLC